MEVVLELLIVDRGRASTASVKTEHQSIAVGRPRSESEVCQFHGLALEADESLLDQLQVGSGLLLKLLPLLADDWIV